MLVVMAIGVLLPCVRLGENTTENIDGNMAIAGRTVDAQRLSFKLRRKRKVVCVRYATESASLWATTIIRRGWPEVCSAAVATYCWDSLMTTQTFFLQQWSI